MSDPRYRAPVAGLSPEQVGEAMRKSIADVQKHFPPQTGVCVFAFDFSAKGDGMAYISNAQRADMAAALREWLNKEASKS